MTLNGTFVAASLALLLTLLLPDSSHNHSILDRLHADTLKHQTFINLRRIANLQQASHTLSSLLAQIALAKTEVDPSFPRPRYAPILCKAASHY